jgi:hypothetical protein
MTHFIIDIYNNNTKEIAREALKFEGDLQTVRTFTLSIIKRLKLNDATGFIYERNGYRLGDIHITKVNYTNLKR